MWIIICVAIMGCYYFYQAGSEQDYVAKRQALTDEQVQTELSEAITRQQSYIAFYKFPHYMLSVLLFLQWHFPYIFHKDCVFLQKWYCRPRGYMITKRRREDKMATGLKKILFGIAGALVGAAGALYVTTTITKWSDGSKPVMMIA